MRVACRRYAHPCVLRQRSYSTSTSASSSFPSSAASLRSPLKLLHVDNYPMAQPKNRDLKPSHKAHVVQILRSEFTGGEIDLEAATLAPPELLKSIHESSYVDRFLYGTMSEKEVREMGVEWTPQLVARQRAKVRAAELVLSGMDYNGIVGVVGGGLHHAKRAKAGGWCALNDLAAAVQYGLDKHGVKRALVVDLDVHQGDGTAEIFKDEPRVVTFSMHARKNFPFRKEISTHDVELEDTISDEEYLKLLRQWLDHLLRIHQPQLVVYQAGVDPLKGDRLGKLSLSRECLRFRTEMVLDVLRSHSPHSKLVITLGGGYAADLSIQAHADVFRATVDWLRKNNRPTVTLPPIDIQAPLW